MVGAHLFIERFDTNQTIIEYGVRGEKYYTILKGSASVWVPNLTHLDTPQEEEEENYDK